MRICVEFYSASNGKYRTRAIKGRSQLVAAPLSFQAKKDFLCLFYVVIYGLKS